MRFSKMQKTIIKKIDSREISDIYTFMKSFNFFSLAQYDQNAIKHAFDADNILKKYYVNNNIPLQYSAIQTPEEFKENSEKGMINPENYNLFELSLKYDYGIKHLLWDGIDYEINFYDGIYIAKSFDNIISFLSLWQYLKSEMLIIELPSNITSQTLGLFYEKHTLPNSDQHLSQNEIIREIDLENYTYSDSHYLKGVDYIFSTEHCTICKEYLDKKIYPTPELNLFIQRNFKTTEEKSQSRALLAAWLAVFVSVVSPLIPNSSEDVKYLSEISTKTNHLEEQLTDIEELLEKLKEQTNIFSSKYSFKLNEINKQVSKITTFLYSITNTDKQVNPTEETEQQTTSEDKNIK